MSRPQVQRQRAGRIQKRIGSTQASGIRPYSTTLCQRNQCALPRLPQPLCHYHRPGFFQKTIVDSKGKERKQYQYEDMKTPYDKLKSLPEAHKFLKEGVTFDKLDAIAKAISDNDAAAALNKARQVLFKSIADRRKKSA